MFVLRGFRSAISEERISLCLASHAATLMALIIMMGNSLAEYAEVIQLARNQLSRETVVRKGLSQGRVGHQGDIL